LQKILALTVHSKMKILSFTHSTYVVPYCTMKVNSV